MTGSAWKRVSRVRRCPICGRGDWCLLSADGAVAICPRTESPKRCGEAGWLHRLTDRRPSGKYVRHISVPAETTPHADLDRLATEWRADLAADRLNRLARGLGLTPASLTALGIGWSASHRAFSFPMMNPNGQVVGIRLRTPSGSKFAVRGSKAGLHIPNDQAFLRGGQLLVAEGPTDCAALLDLGFPSVVGRYSCLGDLRLLSELMGSWRPDEVVIVADADEPGRRGAELLASTLLCRIAAVRVVVPPSGAKDARDYLNSGGSRAGLEEVIAAAPALRLRVVGGRTAP